MRTWEVPKGLGLKTVNGKSSLSPAHKQHRAAKIFFRIQTLELLGDQLNTVESPSERFLDDLFLEYGDQISSSPASSFISHGSENTRSSSSSPPNISTPSTSSTSKREALQKRVGTKNEDENNGENRGYKKPKLGPTRGPHRGKIPGRRLACPFHIFDSEKYCKNSTTRTKYNTCSGPGFPEWHYLK